MTVTVPTEVRCPAGKLLAKVRLTDEKPVMTPGNLLELHCRDCTKWERREDASVDKVLHRYDFVGELVETVVERYGRPQTVRREDHRS